MSSGDVGCGMFQCFSNNSCEIQGLDHICLTLLHNAGHYDSQVRISQCVSHSFTLKINSLSQLCRYACGALTDRLRGSSEVAWAGLEKAYLDTCFLFHLIPSIIALICEECLLYKKQCIVMHGSTVTVQRERGSERREQEHPVHITRIEMYEKMMQA